MKLTDSFEFSPGETEGVFQVLCLKMQLLKRSALPLGPNLQYKADHADAPSPRAPTIPGSGHWRDRSSTATKFELTHHWILA